MTLQDQAFSRRQRFKANTDFFKQLSRIKNNPVHFRFIEVKTVEIKQVAY